MWVFVIILGIDPGYAIVGYGVIEKNEKNNCRVIAYGTIETPKEENFPLRLKIIKDGMNHLIEKYKPDEIAIEELFFNDNITTGIKVAEARGVILCTAVEKLGALYEYTPLQIKQAITGNGRADKKQVQYMTTAMLSLKSIPKPDDAADALAAALCHAQTNKTMAGSAMDTLTTGNWTNRKYSPLH